MPHCYDDPYQGDPKLILGPDGSSLKFVDGQPIMDHGLENMVFILLFTRPGWCGNSLFDNPENQIGSDFEEAANQPITLQTFNDIRDAAQRALSKPVFGVVSAEVSNPDGKTISVRLRIEPPGSDIIDFLLVRNNQNWIAQAINPAYERI